MMLLLFSVLNSLPSARDHVFWAVISVTVFFLFFTFKYSVKVPLLAVSLSSSEEVTDAICHPLPDSSSVEETEGVPLADIVSVITSCEISG